MQEERQKMIKRLEKLVEQGKLEQSALDAVKAATGADPHHRIGVEVSPGVFKDVPEVEVRRSEYVYEHKAGTPPVPRISETERMRLVSRVDMGPSKWSPDGDGSVFSVSEGARLAGTPTHMSPHEQVRMAKVAAAAVETPTLFGFKVVPAMTPGRTFFWGSILAVWGTAALIAASMKSLGVSRAEDGPHAVGGTMSPVGQRLAGWFMPWRSSWGSESGRQASEAETSEFVKRLKESMVTKESGRSA